MHLFLSVLLASAVPQAPAPASPVTTFPAPTWLTGCWTAEGAEVGSAEVWMPMAGGSMLGMSRRVAGGRTLEYEFMQIRVTTDGKIEFRALPSGQSATTFVQIRGSDKEVVFENSGHDFPQRVTYRLEGTDRLLGRIEGSIKGEQRAVDFPFQRGSCDRVMSSTPVR